VRRRTHGLDPVELETVSKAGDVSMKKSSFIPSTT